MNFKTGLAVTAVVVGLSAGSMAMEHARDRGQAQLDRAAWRQDTHNRTGYDQGKKTGWNDGSLPPGKAKKESKMWRQEHKKEGKEHRHEMTTAQREARAHRHRSHEAIVRKQPKPPVNAEKKSALKTVVDAAKANKEHRQEAQHH